MFPPATPWPWPWTAPASALLLEEPYISWSEDPLRRLLKRKSNEEVTLVVLREEQAIGHIRLMMGGPANAGK